MSLRAKLAGLTSTAPVDIDDDVPTSVPNKNTNKPLVLTTIGTASSSSKQKNSRHSSTSSTFLSSNTNPKNSAYRGTNPYSHDYEEKEEDEEANKLFDYDKADDSGAYDNTNATLLKRRKHSERNEEEEDKHYHNASSSLNRSSLRARAQFVADIESDPKYAGKVVKNAKQALRGGSSEEEDDEEEEDEEEEEIDDDDDDDDDEYSVDNDEEEEDDDDDDNSSSSSSSAEEESSLLSTYLLSSSSHRPRSTKLSSVDDELYRLTTADQQAKQLYTQTLLSDAEKGKASAAHIELYEKWLGYRIALQSLLTSSNKLPILSSTIYSTLVNNDNTVKEQYQDTQTSLRNLLSDLLHIRGTMLSGIPSIAKTVLQLTHQKISSSSSSSSSSTKTKPSSEQLTIDLAKQTLIPRAGEKRKRTIDSDEEEEEEEDTTTTMNHTTTLTSEELWEKIHLGWNSFSAFRDDTIDKWNRRVAYASGLSAKKAVKLRVLGSDLSKQVNAIFQNPLTEGNGNNINNNDENEDNDNNNNALYRKIMQKSKMTKADVGKHLCEPVRSNTSKNNDKDLSNDIYDNETYTDNDFFTTLLSEFTTSQGQLSLLNPANDNGSIPGFEGKTGIENYKAGYNHTHREGTDRKSSKARRLRYVVHPKLTHFCTGAPYIVPPELAVDLDTVISSLFAT